MNTVATGERHWSRGHLLGALGRIALRRRGLDVGSDLVLHGWPIIYREPGSHIEIGHHVVMASNASKTALGVAHPVVIRTLTRTATISVGNHVGLSGASICAAGSISIGDECLIGADVKIVDTDFHPLAAEKRRFAAVGVAEHAPVVIGRNVFLGAGSMVLKGVTIGENAVIGCGSVVTRDVPGDCVAGGNPCRVIRRFLVK